MVSSTSITVDVHKSDQKSTIGFKSKIKDLASNELTDTIVALHTLAHIVIPGLGRDLYNDVLQLVARMKERLNDEDPCIFLLNLTHHKLLSLLQ